MSREDELEILKLDLENIIEGMTICGSVLTREESKCLSLFRRCLSVLKRIKVDLFDGDNELHG